MKRLVFLLFFLFLSTQVFAIVVDFNAENIYVNENVKIGVTCSEEMGINIKIFYTEDGENKVETVYDYACLDSFSYYEDFLGISEPQSVRVEAIVSNRTEITYFLVKEQRESINIPDNNFLIVIFLALTITLLIKREKL